MSSCLALTTMRTSASTDHVEVRPVYILVMGLTGAGKSTFISVVTGDHTIPVGDAGTMDGVTEEVQDYAFYYRQGSVLYEIHLIDSPGFDDGADSDVKILSRIAEYINMTYKLKQTLAGVLYLHDITKQRMGGVGERNLRMLEEMVGVDKWNNCTLVTTKWGCTTDPQGEADRENTLRNSEKYFGAMLKSAHQARMARFNPSSKGCALDIIKPLLGNSFDPHISVQMVDPKGPKLALGDTNAGKVVADGMEKILKAKGEIAKLQESEAILAEKFNEKIFEEYKVRRDKLILKHRFQRGGRWAIRTAIVGGSIAATVVTMGPGAALIALEPGYEKIANRQRRSERAAMEQMRRDFKDNAMTSKGLGRYNPIWLEDKNVKSLQDLDSLGYSMNSDSASDSSEVESNDTEMVKEG